MSTPPLSRRAFVANAAALGAGVMIVPRHVLGGPGFTAPSDQLAIGVIGAGGMGAANAYALVKGGQRIAAIADVDPARADRGAADRAAPNPRTGEVDPDGTRMVQQYAKAARYADYRRMLEREKGLDAVVIATPDHFHAVAAKAAMELGKHVYVQKPLTYTVHEARVLRDTARRTRVVTQMGNQGHSSRDAQLINQWIRAGAIGPVREVLAWTNRPIWPQGVPYPAAPGAASGPPGAPFGNAVTSRSLNEQLAAAMAGAGAQAPPAGLDWDLYCGPAPLVPYHPVYHPFNWRGWTNFGVGALGDMGAHLIDHPYWALGLTYPTSVEATSTPWGGDQANPASYPMAMQVHYDFPARGDQPPVRMTWLDGGLMPQRPPVLPDDVVLDRGGGVLIVGDKGVLMHETYGANPRIFPDALFRSVAPEYVEERERERREQEARRQQGPNAPGGAGRPRQVAGTPTVTHEMNWVNAIKNKTQAISPFEYAGPLTETMLLGIVALRAGQGRKIVYDGERMAIPNAREAEQYLRREYRAGWTL
jgi:predicted dehydrogenase